MPQIRLDLDREAASTSSSSQNARSSSEALIQVNDLRVLFSKETGFVGYRKQITKAVNDVSFDLYPSETLSLIGESGSGKTTIARCITGLLTPTNGSVKYRGEDVTKLRGKALRNYRKEVQIVFQDPFGSMIPFQSVETFLSVPLKRLRRENNPSKIRDAITELIEEVGLELEVLKKLPHQLSGGERQRVNIARALASDPKILIADEPVTMLDASQRLNILYLLMNLQSRRSLSILMITHDLSVSKVMGGRIAVLYLGKLVETGPTKDVLAHPAHPYTELLISAAPRSILAKKKEEEGGKEEKKESHDLGHGFDSLSSTIEASQQLSTGCVFRNRCRYSTRVCVEIEPNLLSTLRSRQVACHNPIKVSDVQPEQMKTK